MMNLTLTVFQLYEIQKDWKEEQELAEQMPGKTEEMKKTLLELWKDIATEGPKEWWEAETNEPMKGVTLNY